jgi:aquaporin TIP
MSCCHELQNLPIDFGHLPKHGFVNLSGLYKVSVLPKSFCELKRLKHLDLSDCHNLKELPECLGHLLQLGYLNLAVLDKAIINLNPVENK